MRSRPEPSRAEAPDLSVRPARFEEVSLLLRLIEGAVEHGCRVHYDAAHRIHHRLKPIQLDTHPMLRCDT